MIEVLKAYLQVATGVGELTRQRALEAARQALAASPAGMVLPVASAGVDGLAAQASALADDLIAASRANRELIGQLVRAEVETVVTRLGLGGQAELQSELAASRARVRELERAAAKPAPVKRATVTRATVTRATVTKAAAKQAAVKQVAAKRATAQKATAQPATAKKATAKKVAIKASAKRATSSTAAKPAAAKRTPAKRTSGSA